MLVAHLLVTLCTVEQDTAYFNALQIHIQCTVDVHIENTSQQFTLWWLIAYCFLCIVFSSMKYMFDRKCPYWDKIHVSTSEAVIFVFPRN